MDDALPPGNGVIVQALIQLGHLFGNKDYLEAAERALYWANGRMLQYPAGHCSMLCALEQYLEPSEQIIIRGPREQIEEWIESARGGFAPHRSCYAIPYDGVSTLPDYLPRLVSIEEQNQTVAYRCENFSCSLPIRSLDELKQALAER